MIMLGFLGIVYLIESNLQETALKQIRHLLPEMKPIRDFQQGGLKGLIEKVNNFYKRY